MTPDRRRQLVRVTAASAALLFAELVMIRWTGSEIPRLAVFKNLVLISSFVGAGVGMAAARQRRWLARVVPILLPTLALAISLLGRFSLMPNLRHIDEFSLNVMAPTVLQWAGTAAFFAGIFMATLLLFAGFGALVGIHLTGSDPLALYVANLGGSLAGTLAFAFVSWAQLGPPAWFVGLAVLVAASAEGRLRIALVLSALGAAGGTALASEEARWSPYSRLAVRTIHFPDRPGLRAFHLSVDRKYFMRLLDLGDGVAAPRVAREHYELPYRFAEPSTVLVLGAGGGNDVAAALRAGASRVDAVEIDPGIVAVGRELHPERPFASPLVHVHVDDARNFLRRTSSHHDLIVVGLLDSQVLLASLPGVRLDNYVYTEESLADMASHLDPEDGLLCLSFSTPDNRWIVWKLWTALSAAFGRPPVTIAGDYDGAVTFLAGPGLGTVKAREAMAGMSERIIPPAVVQSALATGPIDMPTDDWPHLYLRDRSIPFVQLCLFGVLLLMSLASVATLGPRAMRIDLHFFLLGAGFLLVETKGIADLGLLFGGTWWTVTFAVLGVLGMALLSAIAVHVLRPRSSAWAYGGLAAALGVSFFVRPADLLGLPLPLAQAAGVTLVAVPVLFSGIVFSSSFATTRDAAAALCSNLMGAALGGILEYGSVVWGIRSMTLLAFVIYGLSALARLRR